MNISPLVTEEDVKAVTNQLRSLWIGRGRKVEELERKMAQWVGAKYAACFGSGTAALVVALSTIGKLHVTYPDDVCEAVKIAVLLAGRAPGEGTRIAIYPNTDGDVIDFARHMPRRGDVTLTARYGVFSFGALKDISGGLGGCLVSNDPIHAEAYKRLSPLSDINAAMILSQLARYEGKADYRKVADGTLWRMT